MKKIVLFLTALLLCLAPTGTAAQSRISHTKISSLVSQYRRTEGFEVIKLGAVSTLAIKKLVNLSAREDPESLEFLRAINGIRRITVIDYEDCRDQVRRDISEQIAGIVSGAELLMEVQDGSDRLSMYGVVSNKGDKVKDFVLFSPNNSALICLFGSLNMDTLMKLAR